MITWLVVFAALWLSALVFFSYRSKRQNQVANDYVFAGANLGPLLGMLTFAATLFSTFTIMGMPDYFRLHGVGSWIFLAIADAAMFFFILWFGHKLRSRGMEHQYDGMSSLLSRCYQSRFAGWLYFVFVFLFMIPYVAIQIRGVGIFFEAIFPDFLPGWGWSVAIVTLMLIYSEIGGLRAIIYSDSLQATVLLVGIWIVGVACIQNAGGLTELFTQVRETHPELLSTPGPQDRLSFFYLLGSLFAIMMIPVTQPQVVTRLIIMQSTQKMHTMVISLGIFAFLVILPTAFIGLYGALNYADAPSREFQAQVLLFEQIAPVGAIIVIGLLAAAISTSDSQIFALGTEFRSITNQGKSENLKIMRLFVLFFGICALVFAINSGDQLVPLALASFKGTALFGPAILLALFAKRSVGILPLIAVLIAEIIFVLYQFKIVPQNIGGIGTYVILFVSVGLVALGSYLLKGRAAE